MRGSFRSKSAWLCALALLGCAPENACPEGPTTVACGLCDARPDSPECAAPEVTCEEDAEQPLCEPPPHALSGELEILRDSLGIPHVYGATDADAMYGSGYTQAVDRLFEMDLARRQALGRQAEVLGERGVDDDQLVRTLDLAGWAEQSALRIEHRHVS